MRSGFVRIGLALFFGMFNMRFFDTWSVRFGFFDMRMHVVLFGIAVCFFAQGFRGGRFVSATKRFSGQLDML